MTVTAPRKSAPEVLPVKRERSWMAYGLAALLVVVVAGLGLWWFGLRDTGGPVDAVEDLIAAQNEGDVAAVLEGYAPDVTPSVLSLPTTPNQTVREFFEWNAALNGRSTIVQACEEYVADVVRCTVRHENDLFDTVGLAPELVHTLRLNADGLVITENVAGAQTWMYIEFFGRYASWLGETHPDAYGQLFPEGQPLMTADTAPIYLQHLDEFVAQSEYYPLG